LEKIIQVPFTLPQVDPARVHKVLFSSLNALLDGLPTRVAFDQRRWGNLFVGGLSGYFDTLRDVYRYTTTLDFHLSIFRRTGTMEVNQIDLLALEALRVFEPTLYHALPEHKRLLLDGPGRYGRRKKEEVERQLA